MKGRKILISIAIMMICVPAMPAPVQWSNFKDWRFKQTEKYWEASTQNASGSELGVLCTDKESCFAYYQDDTQCKAENVYPLLWNSDSGSLLLTATCTSIGASGTYLLVFDKFETVRDYMLKDQSTGIAIPLASGQFKVLKFSLNGSNEAMSALVAGIKSIDAKSSSVRNANQVL